MHSFRLLGAIFCLGLVDAQDPGNNQGFLSCHGVTGDFRVLSREIAIEHIKSFCKQKTKKVKYEDDADNALQLSITRPGRSCNRASSPLDTWDCEGHFQRIVDGCDIEDPVNNPHNYKYGGVYVAQDGSAYSMKPLHEVKNGARCIVDYRPSRYSWMISGKNVPFAKLGANGQGLLDNLRGCGAVEDWTFEHGVGVAGKYEWSATGSLPLSTKPCIERAIGAVGVNVPFCIGNAH